MRKINEENERIKRRYLQFLKNAKRKDISTVHKAAEGILS
jgi:integrase/recombinase XerD